MKKLALILINFYKKYLSPENYGMKICRYAPTCSTYTYEAISKYGVAKGTLLGMYRILRCNPFAKGGFDPVK
ncbi:membrane protein insertion efficiency factor YidD [Patescibacteria group bacterium]|nr:membrane protein insertion efficiency factor YidD [Patescibacteria group bacterium]